jgi:SAM-dependent methyltransferase
MDTDAAIADQQGHHERMTEVLPPSDAYDLAAPYYDAWSWQAFWRKHEFPLIKSEITASQNNARELIDLGCGTGHYLGRLAPLFSRSVGVDISVGMLAVASAAQPLVEFHKADLVDLPFGDRTFDVALSCRAMTHLPDPKRAFVEIARVLRAEGIAIVTNIDHGPRFGNTRLPVPDDANVFTTTYKHDPEVLAATALACGLERTRCLYISMYGETKKIRRAWDEDIVGSVSVFRKLPQSHHRP